MICVPIHHSFWVSDEYGPYIHHFDPAGNLLQTLQPPDAILPRINGTLNFTSVTDPDTGRVGNQGKNIYRCHSRLLSPLMRTPSTRLRRPYPRREHSNALGTSPIRHSTRRWRQLYHLSFHSTSWVRRSTPTDRAASDRRRICRTLTCQQEEQDSRCQRTAFCEEGCLLGFIARWPWARR